jgi:hypothetical protein
MRHHFGHRSAHHHHSHLPASVQTHIEGWVTKWEHAATTALNVITTRALQRELAPSAPVINVNYAIKTFVGYGSIFLCATEPEVEIFYQQVGFFVQQACDLIPAPKSGPNPAAADFQERVAKIILQLGQAWQDRLLAKANQMWQDEENEERLLNHLLRQEFQGKYINRTTHPIWTLNEALIQQDILKDLQSRYTEFAYLVSGDRERQLISHLFYELSRLGEKYGDVVDLHYTEYSPKWRWYVFGEIEDTGKEIFPHGESLTVNDPGYTGGGTPLQEIQKECIDDPRTYQVTMVSFENAVVRVNWDVTYIPRKPELRFPYPQFIDAIKGYKLSVMEFNKPAPPLKPPTCRMPMSRSGSIIDM